MSGHTIIKKLGNIACGLNIEGCRPVNFLPDYCKWFNIIQVIDTPLTGNTFDNIMEEMFYINSNTIEEAAGIDLNIFINDMVKLINNIKKDYPKLLVHIHQNKNTTKINLILSKILNMKIIMDEINFYSTPVDYEKFYPEIDALLSISQCAGFDLPTGCYIVPNSFMEYDTFNNIIYTNKTIHHTDIIKYIDFDYATGSILYVKELWNPDNFFDDILLLDNRDEMVLNFVKQKTEIFDESHDWRHAINVAKTATKILNNKHVLYLALLHDVCDHKYPNSISRKDLSIWINIYLQEYNIIDDMIDDISFSKQFKMNEKILKCSPARMHSPECFFNPNEIDPIIIAVRDADRLEAIGEIGIKRCEQYTKKINGKIPEDVIKHCYDKLLKLVPEKFIVSKTIRDEAIKRHNYVVKYVKINLPRTNLNYEAPNTIDAQ